MKNTNMGIYTYLQSNISGNMVAVIRAWLNANCVVYNIKYFYENANSLYAIYSAITYRRFSNPRIPKILR